MTREEWILERISTETLADMLIHAEVAHGFYVCPDCKAFEYLTDAIDHTVEWLNEEM